MSFVIDATVTLIWYFRDETTPAGDAVLDGVSESGAIVPTLWRLEVANAFQSALRRKRITAPYRDQALTERAALSITVDTDTDKDAWRATLGLADQFGLTIYDATDLERAKRRNLPLATLDKGLPDAAPSLNVGLER